MDPFAEHVPPAPNGNGTNAHAANELAQAFGAVADEAAAIALDIKPRQAVMARHKFRLEHTGSDALVRHIPLARLLTLTGLSPTMLPIATKIYDIVNGTDLAIAEGNQLELLRKNDALVDGVVMLGFIRPRVVETQAEADAANDPMVWSIDDVDPRDRQAYFDLVTSPEREAAKVLAPFPAGGMADLRPDESLPAAPPPEPGTGATDADEPRPVELSQL